MWLFWISSDARNRSEFKKRLAFVKVVTKNDILIFCFISMFDDSFDFKSFIVDIILSSLEKIFRFFALIDTEVINMTFIDESLMSELCECFDIQSILLSKSKLIQSYDEISDWKSITYALYTLIMIQEHKNEMMSLLITCLDQHKIIIENLWLKRNQMLIDSANNQLISSLKIWTLKSVILKASSQSAFYRFESNEICEMKRKNLNLIVTSTIILKRLMNQKSVNRFIESALIAKQSTQVDLNQLCSFQSTETKKLVNIVMIKVVVYQTLTQNKKIKIFFLIISEINKALSSVKDFAKMNEMISVMSLNELKKKLLIVYHDFLNVFDREKITQLPLHRSYNHKIELEEESQLSRSWLYLMSSYKLQKIKEYLEENLKKKFITFSKAFFASLILFVKKKDDSLCFCMNYWKLNALIKRNRYSILLIDEVLAQIQGSKYLTRLDIIITFNKLHMSSESEDLTTFVTFFNVYKYRITLFELINESAFFQHYINNVLFNCLHKFCQTYLNDILIYSKTLKEHRTHVKEVLEKLREVNLQINIDKCEFKIQKISFLELLIFINDLRMNSWKVDVIQDWEVSRSLTHVQIFIDFCNFYRWFIKNFSKIARFMIKLTWKDHFFEWTEICQTIFEELKQQVTTVLILKHFNSIREAILKTDFLNYVNDEVLSQYDDEDILHSMIFYSKNMILAECNYEIYDKKLLIIIRCLKHWCFKLKCTNILIKIFINHLNLKYFMIIKELIRWQAKWAEKLSEYNFKIIYQLRKQNLKVDALIRMSDVKSVEANDDCKLYQHQMLLSEDRFELQLIEDDQKADQDLTQILLRFNSESDSESDSDSKLESKANQNSIKEMISIQNQIIVENQMNQLCFNIQIIMKQNRKTCQDINLDNCKILDEVLWKDDRLWVSQLMIILLIRKAHDLSISDHHDMNQTLNLLRWSYCWLKMRTMIKHYIWNCYVYCKSKALRDRINELLKSLLILEQRWQNISLDFIINLSESDESNAILTVIDRLSKKWHYISCWSDDEEIFVE